MVAYRPLMVCRCQGSLACAGRISTSQIRTAYDLNNVIMTAARVPQIIKNYRVRLALPCKCHVSCAVCRV